MARQEPENNSPRSVWPWVGAGVGVLAVAGFGAWWVWGRSGATSVTGGGSGGGGGGTGGGAVTGPAAPDGYELHSCENYVGRTLCALKSTAASGVSGFLGRFHWRIGSGPPSETGYLSAALAIGAGRRFVDELEAEPKPESTEPEASQEPDQPQGGGFASSTSVAGVTASTVNGACVGITLDNLAVWVPFASELLEGLNLDAWTSQELMDRIWKEVFPVCGDHVSQIPGFSVNGAPYADVVATGQTFLDELDALTLVAPHTPESVFAGYMVGEPYVAPPVEPVLQIDPGPDAPELLQYTKPNTSDAYWIVTTLKPILLPGKDPTQESTWRVWGPNTNVVGEPVAEGSTGGRPASLAAARAWVNGVN